MTRRAARTPLLIVGSRIGFLAASREGADSFFESGGLTEHSMEPGTG
ncbi:hypothetical protein [Streptomyces sp. SID7909]|nr:hypothetical protein [Streptomyces sp. SID7909]